MRFAVRHSGVFWYRGSLSDVAATLRGDGDALVLEGSARRLDLHDPAGRDQSERAGAGVLRCPESSRDHVPLDGGSPRRRWPGRGRRRAHDQGCHAPGHRQRSLRPTATGRLRRGRGTAAPDEASTAATSGSSGRRSCPAVATPSAGTWRWTSICCSCERTQMLRGDVLLVSGSLRRGSYNTALLREAANALPSGVGHGWLDGIAALPPYSEDDDGERAPAAVERLRRTIAAAEAVLIATPEYNGSIPGGLKNAVDWASRPFPDNAWRDKPVAVIGASTGIFGAIWAQAELRKSLRKRRGARHRRRARRRRRTRSVPAVRRAARSGPRQRPARGGGRTRRCADWSVRPSWPAARRRPPRLAPEATARWRMTTTQRFISNRQGPRWQHPRKHETKRRSDASTTPSALAMHQGEYMGLPPTGETGCLRRDLHRPVHQRPDRARRPRGSSMSPRR